MTTDDSKAALAAALHEAEINCNPWATPAGALLLHEDDAAATLGERGVFWPTGKDEYRELIRQYQAEITLLRDIAADNEAEIVRLTARIIRLFSGLRESAGARHAIGHAGQEITGDIIDFEHCQRAGCVSARAAIVPALDDIHGTPTFSG